MCYFFFFKQKTAYEMRISDWSSDVCSSDLDRTVERLIEADGYDYHFDLAVREWARGDKRAGWAVERADRERLERLRAFFEALGYDRQHAAIRARVFYYHQIGYYAIGEIGRASCRERECQDV